MKTTLVKIFFVCLILFGMSIKAEAKHYLHSDSPQVEWYVFPCSEDKWADLRKYSEHPGALPQQAVKAIVPGTVFASYVAAGKEEDPNFGDNIHRVDRQKYDRGFWYRTEFLLPEDLKNDEIQWLHFQGVNRKAEIYLNGLFLGQLDGFMHRGRFDISSYLRKDDKNVLLVKVEAP